MFWSETSRFEERHGARDAFRFFRDCALILLLALCAARAWAQTAVSGAIVADTRWTLAGGPYLISGDLIVRNAATLSIDPGVTVYMGTGAGLTVEAGAIKAQGTASDPIRVLSDNTRTGVSAAPGDWNQWVFTAGAVNTRLDHVVFQHGKGLVVNGSAPVFNDLDLRDHAGAAVTVDLAASPSGVGNQASGNTVNGVAVPAGNVTGNVNWALRGIPYVVSSGVVAVGGPPVINSITPNALQQGDSATLTLTGSRLTGLTDARFDASGVTAQVLPGGTSTQANVSVTVSATAATGASGLSLLVDAGELRVPVAISIDRRRPIVTSLSPSSVFVAQGAVDVLVNWRNFDNQSLVLVGGNPVTTQLLSATQLRATVASQDTAGTLPVRVRAPDPLNAGQFLFSDELGLSVVSAVLTLSPAVLSIDRGTSGTLTLTLPYAAPASGITVNLVSSAPGIATVPPTVTVPQGATSAGFQVAAVAGGVTTISASANGFVGAQAQVTVIAMCPAAPPGLVGWWTGDGTANDKAGTNHGVLQNGATFAAGKVGQAFSLDGVNDYVNLGTSPAFTLGDFTIHAWVSTDPADNTGERRVVGFDDIGLPVTRQFYDLKSSSPFTCGASGRPALQIQGATGGLSQICAPAPLTAGFHHLAGVRSGTTLSLYVDGVLVATQANASSAVITPTAPLVIGQVSPNFNAEFFKGLIDEVAIHNRALTASEISGVFEASGSGMCKQCVAPAAGIADWWPADGTMNDIVGTNHGVPSSGVTFAAGKVGRAAAFDGIGGQVSFGGSAGNFGTADFTVHFWIKTNSTRSEGVIGKRPVCAHANFWDLRMNAGRLSLELDQGGANYLPIGTSRAVNDNVFHHVAIVRQGATASIYIDGIADVSGSSGIANVDNAADLIAGRSACTGADGTAFFTGLLDELTVMSRALSGGEIQAIIAAGSAGMCHTQCATISPKPVSWWTGDGNANDLMKANPASLQGGAAFTSAKVGKGFSLDGIDDYVLVNHHPSLDPGIGSFSLEAWVRTSRSAGRQVVISKYECGQLCLSNAGTRISNSAYIIFVTDGVIQGFVRDSDFSDGLTLTGTKFIADNAFHHVALVRDIGTGTLRLYVDGVLDGSAPLAPAADGAITDNDNDPDPLVIGAKVAAGQTTKEEFFAGVIDEVRYYSRALTNLEVNALFQADKVGMCVP
jgi:hypothetical protein